MYATELSKSMPPSHSQVPLSGFSGGSVQFTAGNDHHIQNVTVFKRSGNVTDEI